MLPRATQEGLVFSHPWQYLFSFLPPSARDWTQSLSYARQALYHCTPSPSFRKKIFFKYASSVYEVVSLFCLGLVFCFSPCGFGLHFPKKTDKTHLSCVYWSFVYLWR
jgi:hypothetical protein